MKEQFDKKLVDKIKASFEHHEEPFDPKEWEKLSTAYFKPKKGMAKGPWILWAASLIAVLGLGLLFFNLNKELDNPHAEELATTKVDIPESSGSSMLSPELDFTEDEEKGKISEDRLIAASGSDQSAKLSSVNTYVPKLENPIALETAGEPHINAAEKDQKTEILDEITPTKTDLANPFITQLKEQEELEAKATIAAWMQEGKESRANEQEEKSKTAPVRLGLVVAPQAVANSNQSLNLGGGLASEFSFSKRLKLDVGMVYASQNLMPNNRMGDGLVLNSPGQPDSNSLLFSQSDVFRSTALNTNIVSTSTELRFGQLEIPLNLKYMIWDKKSAGLYVLSGLSNMFFLNQRSISTFSTVAMNSGGLAIGQNSVQTFTQTTRPESGSDSGNMGQLINFGFGYEHSLNNGTFISVEPFYKTSLGGQTFMGQQLSIGGLNLRMSFQLKK